MPTLFLKAISKNCKLIKNAHQINNKIVMSEITYYMGCSNKNCNMCCTEGVIKRNWATFQSLSSKLNVKF